ncbi:toxin-antitoxin system YwqK family antitoxin [Tenacibaculum sp. SDUM215027]|uniref:toxin-antitoxin system YwqK family antitoxin n=1 Tax=Tenacibaculum sp. SDUM215027 TaxID=3422596 RepID=UPI003D32373A
MKGLIIILSFLLVSCISQKHTKPSIVSVSNEEAKDIVKLYFWWEIEKIDNSFYDKQSKDILEDGFYSININNCGISDDIVTKSGDMDKRGYIKKGKFFKKWVYLIDNDTLKIVNYNIKGLLDGNYIIYTQNKKTKYKTTFRSGTGYYKNYCFRTEKLKEEGQYLKGKKNGYWIFYDEKGNETHREYYKKGVLINQ